jgi:Ca2+-binding RTX toxin-like protein
VLGEGIVYGDVYLARAGANYEDLAVLMPDGGSVTVREWFTGEEYQLSEIRFADGGIWTREQINDTAPAPGEPAGQTINGTSGSNTLTGGDGNDTISGLGGSDSITGGKGNDRLEGGSGDDTYYWNMWDGDDTIYDPLGTNILVIGEGIDPSDVKFTRTGTSCRDAVFIMPSGERITVERWFSGSAYQMDEIHFADGTVWTRKDVNAFSTLFEGTDAAETIQGSPGGDTIIGGIGDDRLEGALGDDAYIWNPGDGNDTIYDYYGKNVLVLGPGIYPGDVKLTRTGASRRDAVLIMPSGERITVERWFSASGYQTDEIHFADGTVWTRQYVNGMDVTLEGTEGADTIEGTDSGDIIYGYGGDDSISGGSGGDTLTGGAGNDRLEGGLGGDTYIWESGDGNDTIHDYYGSNILILGSGITPDSVTFTRSGTSLNITHETGHAPARNGPV